MTGEALRLKAKKLFYPVFELVGTLFAYFGYGIAKLLKNEKEMTRILATRNPFDNKRGQYCIAFVNHCFEAVGRRLIPDGVNESVSDVGDGLRGRGGYTLTELFPVYTLYSKLAGRDFDIKF
jgi:hypothetical protein